MINIPLTKILFIDIETVGCCPNLDVCETLNTKLYEQFMKYFNWFQKRFPEDLKPLKKLRLLIYF